MRGTVYLEQNSTIIQTLSILVKRGRMFGVFVYEEKMQIHSEKYKYNIIQ
jgi:hypothetical protein